MFGLPSGYVGISCIGFIGGYYFARFFDLGTINAAALATLLALLGIGTTALVLVQGYFQLGLLDPYGIGLMLGVLGNLILRNIGLNVTLRRLTVAPRTPSEAVGQAPQEPPRVSFLETVYATSSARSLEDQALKAVESRYLSEFAKPAVERWLKSQFPDVEVQSRETFPDFIMPNRKPRLGFVVITAGQSRAVFNLLLRYFLLSTRKSIRAGEFDEAWLILVANNVGRAKELSELLSEWRPGLPVRVVVGVLSDDGTFTPIDKG